MENAKCVNRVSSNCNIFFKIAQSTCFAFVPPVSKPVSWNCSFMLHENNRLKSYFWWRLTQRLELFLCTVSAVPLPLLAKRAEKAVAGPFTTATHTTVRQSYSAGPQTDQGRIKLFGAPRQWKHFRPVFQAVFLSGGGGSITPQTVKHHASQSGENLG